MKKKRHILLPSKPWIHTGILLASTFFLLIGGCKEEADSETPTDQTKPGPKTDSSAEAVVLEAFQAERVQRDIKAYLALWGIDCALSHGKGRTASDDDPPPLDCRQLEAWTRIDMSRPEISDGEFTHENIQVKEKGKTTIVSMDLVMTKGNTTVKTRERFKLKQQDGIFKITEKRSWPLQSITGETTTDYNEEYWISVDHKVAEIHAKGAGDSSDLVNAMLSAYKFNAAYAEANRAFEYGKEMTAKDWLQFATVSLNCGHLDTAVKAYRKVRELDPEIAVPSGAFY